LQKSHVWHIMHLGTGTIREKRMAKRKPIGQMLVDKGLIQKEHVKKALEYQQKSGEDLRLGEILVKFGFVSEQDVLECVGEQFDVPVVDLREVKPQPEALDSVPKNTARMQNILPLEKDANSIAVAMSDLDLYTIDNLKFVLDAEIRPMLAPEGQIAEAIERYYGGEESTVDNMLREFTQEAADEEAKRQATGLGVEEGEEVPIIRLVTLIISDAVRARASDVHIEPLTNRLRVRYRVDGVCQEMESPPKRLQGPVLSRVKLMAGMDLAEKRKPQDGRIAMKVDSRDIDLRVSAIPITDGESIVLRILEKESTRVSLTELGLHETDLVRFRRLINRPNGILLVTGPTGSGKTTTLYCALNELNRPDTKIISAEDPVEYHMSGVNQSQVNEAVGRTFGVILRSMLRQAPEIILVGEMRDEETAEIAIRAALTGHLVFSTLHTNDAPSAIPRLIDMGIKPFMVASSIQAIMAQRLIRRICPKCKKPHQYPEKYLAAAGLRAEDVQGITFYRGTGCYRCSGTGYRDRIGIFEMMEMNSELREMAFRKAATTEIRAKARSYGMLTLLEDGLRKVMEGYSTVEEVLRVAGTVGEVDAGVMTE